MDYLAMIVSALPLAVLVALLCATLICIVAILRAHRGDTVEVLRALPAIIAAMLRHKP